MKKLLEWQLAYIADIVDGEGCISIDRHKEFVWTEEDERRIR